MIDNINTFNYFFNPIRNINKTNRIKYNNLCPLSKDTVSFKGMSLPSQYKTSFDYLAAEILKGSKKWNTDGSVLSASNISKAVDNLFVQDKVYETFKKSNPLKIRWKSYIPQEVRIYCTDKINDARSARLNQWRTFLENPKLESGQEDFRELVDDINNDNSLKFVIWNSINSELGAANRHIPVPFDLTALDETVRHFKNIEPKFRAVACASASFLDMYTHRLRDNLLMKKGISDNKSVWVRIPSIKKDPAHKEENIADLEVLSYKNWCTRSSLDKAEDALKDGDFYVYLERDDANLWHSLLGMTTLRGKIDQIQGRENNNLIPLQLLDTIKDFLKSNNLKCSSGLQDEKPDALQQILIAEKLLEHNEATGKNLSKALKDRDNLSVLKILGYDVKGLQDETFEINTYKPSLLLDSKSGIAVPYCYASIDENALLENVSKINGDLVLYNKNFLFNSSITKFPPKLEKVSGKVICTQEQFNKFKDDILRVTGGDSARIIVH